MAKKSGFLAKVDFSDHFLSSLRFVLSSGKDALETNPLMEEYKPNQFNSNYGGNFMKVFISTRFSGLPEEEVRATLAKAEAAVKAKFGKDAEIVHNYDYVPGENVKDKSMRCIGAAIKKMANCDAIAFVGDYSTRGCWVEEEIAKHYDMTRIYKLVKERFD